MLELLHSIVNIVRANKGMAEIDGIIPATNLRADLGFDSLDLAELTVRIERETGVDVFADGNVSTIGEVITKLHKND